MIQQNDFKRQWEFVESAALEAMRRVGASGWYILGKEVEQFESALARIWGVPHAVGVGNGMDALEIGLRCLGLRPHEKVVTTPLSAFATTLAIFRAGGVPVFVDVDDLGRIDLRQCRTVFAQDRSIRFFLPVYLYGFPLDLVELQNLKTESNLLLVEDCAQAIGASYGEAKVGTIGQVAGVSFYPTKNLGALGDGGALLTSDAQIAEKAKALRNYGQASLYFHDDVGLNSRLDEIQAALLSDALLPMLERWTKRRRQTAQRYCESIRNQHIRLPIPEKEMKPVWHLFPIFVPESSRENLREYLKAVGIQTGVHYPRTIPEQAAVKKHGSFEVLFDGSNARRISNCELSLPIHPFLQDDEVTAVIEACNSWVP